MGKPNIYCFLELRPNDYCNTWMYTPNTVIMHAETNFLNDKNRSNGNIKFIGR